MWDGKSDTPLFWSTKNKFLLLYIQILNVCTDAVMFLLLIYIEERDITSVCIFMGECVSDPDASMQRSCVERCHLSLIDM